MKALVRSHDHNIHDTFTGSSLDITSVSSSSRPTRGSQAPPAPTMATERLD